MHVIKQKDKKLSMLNYFIVIKLIAICDLKKKYSSNGIDLTRREKLKRVSTCTLVFFFQIKEIQDFLLSITKFHLKLLTNISGLLLGDRMGLKTDF